MTVFNVNFQVPSIISAADTRYLKGIPFVLILICLLLSGCAKNLPPPGGPEDKTPPSVVEIYPGQNEVNVDNDSKIKITFSESMNRKAISDDIFISPLFEVEPEYSWKGKTLIIKPEEPLMENRTYVVVVGTNVSDSHNNRLDYPYSFAFSTGDSLDKGSISGYAYIENKVSKGLGIWAYMIADSIVPDPVNEIPDYLTQTGEDGSYSLNYLAPGVYRLFAVDDKNKDKLWDSDSEKYGTAPHDVRVDGVSDSLVNVNLTAALIDTIPPMISFCSMLPGGILKIDFETELDFISAGGLSNYKFRSESGWECPFAPVSIFTLPRNQRSVFIVGHIVNEGVACSLFVSGISSISGVMMDTIGNSCVFVAGMKPDITAPTIVSSYPKNGDKYFPPDSALIITFSEPMLTDSIAAAFSLTDTLNNVIRGDFYWIDKVILRFKPDSLLGKMQYSLELNPSSILDMNNLFIEDSIWSVKFTTMSSDTGGTVTGKIIADEDAVVGLVFLPIGRGNAITFFMPEPGKYSYDGIPGGKYRVYAFLDRDEDGSYFTGGFKPFKFSEPRAFFPDTIDVRSRWETDGVIIRIH